MSGYLRRLIDTAVRGNSVHPTTGSIFAPHQTEIGAPLQGAEETESGAALQTPPASRATPPRAGEPRGVAPRSLPAPLLPPTAAPLTFSRADGPRGSKAEPALDFDEPSQRPVRERGEAEIEDEQTLPHRSPLGRQVDDAPSFRDEEGQDSRSLIRPAGAVDGVTRSDWPRSLPQERPAAQGAREPDEIQIHIGRIEVIAMQQPAPPRPTKAPPQSMTLDGYLGRRDGKSR